MWGDGGDGGGGDGFPRTLESGRSPGPTCPGTKYPVRGIPHFDKSREHSLLAWFAGLIQSIACYFESQMTTCE